MPAEEVYTSDFFSKYYEGAVPDTTEVVCNHAPGGCTWEYCPKCKKNTLHRFVKEDENLRIMEIDECQCGFRDRRRIAGPQ